MLGAFWSLPATAGAAVDTLTMTPPPNPAAGVSFSLPISGTTYTSFSSVDVYAIPGAATCDSTDLQAIGDYDTDAEGFADISNAGGFSTTVSMTLPSAGSYTLCGYVDGFASDEGMAAASVTASAPGNLTISPPSNPSAGSYFEVPVSGTSDASGLSLVTLYATAPGQACAASSAALSDYEFDPQGTALVTGPGSFSNAVGIDVATPGIYQLCGYVGTFGVEASATVTVVSLACGEAPDLSVTAPATVLAGRRGAVVISPGSSNVLGTDSNVSVGTAPANPAEPIHFPSSGQTPEAAVGVDDEYDGGFQTHIGDGPIMVTIQWTQMAADGSTCTRIAASMPVTVVNSGQQAALRMRTSLVNAQATLAFTGDCELIGPSPATVTLKGAGLVRRFRLPDVCGRWSRTGGPGLPNLSVGTQSASVTTPASLDLFTAGGQTASHSYTLMARYAGATHTFQLVASVTHQPLTLVYEGTDAFVNYCIDDAKRIMSLNHQLYCVRPGFTLRGLTVTK